MNEENGTVGHANGTVYVLSCTYIQTSTVPYLPAMNLNGAVANLAHHFYKGFLIFLFCTVIRVPACIQYVDVVSCSSTSHTVTFSYCLSDTSITFGCHGAGYLRYQVPVQVGGTVLQ